MRRTILMLAAAVAVVVPTGCTSSKGSRADFCRELRRAPGLEEVLGGIRIDDPATIRRKLEDATKQFSRLEKAAPREIRSDVTEVSDLVDKIAATIERSPNDPQAIAQRLRAVAVGSSGTAKSALKLVEYGRDKCKLDLDRPAGGARDILPTTSTPGGSAPEATLIPPTSIR